MGRYVAYDESAYVIAPRKAATRQPTQRVSPGTAKRRAILERLDQPSPAALLASAQRTVALAEQLHAQGRRIPAEMLTSARRALANSKRRARGLPMRTAAELGIKTRERRDE